MLDGGGGGGGYAGITNWYLYDVPTMWAIMQNQKTDSQWTQVSGWRKAYELTSTHKWRLEEYRDKLAEAWPPEKSAASAAYMERLNYLINTVQQTYDVASANYSTLSTATVAIDDARGKLKKIYDDYAAKQKQIQEYEERVEAERASMLPGVALGDPPATQADLERLNNQARSIMYGLSGELTQAQAQIKQPPEYTPSRTSTDQDPNTDVYGGGGGSAPPPIPPIVPMPSGGSSTRPPAPSPGVVTPIAPAPTAPGQGPILGGTGPIMPPAPNPTIPNIITPTAPAPSPVPPLTGPLPGLPPRPGPLPGSPSPTSPSLKPTGPGKASLGPSVPGGPRAMPPGGLIGGTPGAGLGQPTAAPPARRINPVGGVIGGSGTGSVGGGTGRSPMAGAGHPGAARRARPGDQRDDDRQQRWDPDNPWETDEGVSPVVLPARDAGPVDPGPAIGFNR